MDKLSSRGDFLLATILISSAVICSFPGRRFASRRPPGRPATDMCHYNTTHTSASLRITFRHDADAPLK
ncbi:unnamed protein product [Colias eurytheme]|nr:unnamed protein product [Colias eurytheme]